MPVKASRISDSSRDANHGRSSRGDQIAPLEAAGLGVQVIARDLGDLRARLTDSGDPHQRAPLPRGQRDDHHPPAVARLEVVAERAVQVVAVLGLVVAAELGLGDPPEVADHRERDVGERQPDCCPSPVRARRRSAASRPIAASEPVAMSQAGSTLLSGSDRLRGPVAHGNPVAGLTV